MFENLQKELEKYTQQFQRIPETFDDEYRIHCAELDIAKAFVYDLGYNYAAKFARAILALGELK